MSNIFSASRFGKYFIYDLKKAYNNFGFGALLTIVTPIIAFVVCQIFYVIFEGHFPTDAVAMKVTRFILLMFYCINILMIAPAKIYGSVTDKRFGSSFILIPASTFEKWLSMFLIAIIIVPVVTFLLFVGVDSLMCVIFPVTYGENVMYYINQVLTTLAEANPPLPFNIFPLMVIGSFSGVLVYLLGGLIFKKNKVSKTILASFAIGMVLSMFLPLFIKFSNFDLSVYHDNYKLATQLLSISYILYAIELTALLFGTYYRLKTIQH